LVSIGKYNNTAKRSDGIANMQYELGDILCDLSENVCFFHGEEFANVHQALSKAATLSGYSMFNDAFDIKQSKKDIDAFMVMSEIDSLLNKYLSKKSSAFPGLLRKLKLTDVVITDAKIFIKTMTIKKQDTLFLQELVKLVPARNLTFKYLLNHTIIRYQCHF
jgi:hypothetical protein